MSVITMIVLMVAFMYRSGDLKVPVVSIPIYVKFGDDGFTFPDLVQAAQIQLDAEMKRHDSRFSYKFIDLLEPSRGNTFAPELLFPNDYSVVLYIAGSESAVVHENFPHVALVFLNKAIHANDLPFYLVQAVLDHLIYSDLYPCDTDIVEDVHMQMVEVCDSNCQKHDILPMMIDKFSSLSNNVFLYLGTMETISTNYVDNLDPLKIYFTVTEEAPLSYDGPVYPVYCDPESDFIDTDGLLQHIAHQLQPQLHISPHPYNNVNLRLGSLLKHLVLEGLDDLLEGVNSRSLPKELRNKVKMLVSSLEEPAWKEMYDEILDIKKRV